MAEEDLAGIKIKDSYEGLLHLSDGGLSTTPGLPTAKPVYDGQGRQTCLNVSSNMLTIKGVAAGLAIDSTNDGDYGFIDQGTTNSGIGLRGFGFYDGTQSSDLFVSSDGNVGVGTEEPIARLQTIPRGGDIASDFTDAGLLVGTADSGVAIDADAIRCSHTGAFKIGTTTANTTGSITFHTGGVQSLAILADGKMRYPYVHPNHGGPANGKVLTCTGDLGGMAWKDAGTISAYARFVGSNASISVNSGFSSIVRLSAGVYRLTFVTPRSGANKYVVNATREASNPLEGDVVVRNRTTTSFVLHSSNDNSSAGDPSALNVTVVG